MVEELLTKREEQLQAAVKAQPGAVRLSLNGEGLEALAQAMAGSAKVPRVVLVDLAIRNKWPPDTIKE
eukprot:6034759-Lingulodinium_polyedra.AAC.1